MRLVFIFLLFFGCQTNEHNLKPLDTIPKEKERNWEYLYSLELKHALYNQDDAAFYFFWPLYLEARYENKQKQLGN